MSPWFLEHGTLSTRGRTLWSPPDAIHIIVGSQSSHVIGQPIYFAMFDEISFIRNQDIEKQKAIATDMMDTAIGGMKTRFIHKGHNPTVLVLASSKRSDKSFLEEHMKKKLAEDHEGTFIVDEPVWNVKPPETYCGKKFLVGVGNRFLTSEILPEGADKKEYVDKGYNVIEVPVEFYVDFSDNIDRALCDYAGISSSELTKYISSSRWEAVKDITYKNPFIKDVISVGNAPDDIAEYYDFIDMSRFNANDMEHPLYVHLDMSKSGDKTGIAGIWIMGKQPDKDSNPGEMYYKLAFSVSIAAPKGYQISMEKNRHFIYWLKENNFVLRGVSTDTFQNVAIEQDLIAKGYPYSIISVDRVDSASKTCKPYAYFKNTIYERRVSIYDCELLTLEALQLERNGNTGKVDHPDGQSKDQCDAFCAAMWNASQHADEFAFEYGEDIDSSIQANSVESFGYDP